MNQRNDQDKPQRRKGSGAKWRLPIGMRSAQLARDGRKSAVIVPGAERAWLPEVRIGDVMQMPINYKNSGSLTVRVTGCCYHERIAEIPECDLGHQAADFDAGADWHTVLCKALWGGPEPAETALIEQRSAQGWFVLDFEVTGLPQAWERQRQAAAV